jgi:hypothetical protein
MVAHIVMWRIASTNANSKEENIRLVREQLAALPAAIPEIYEYEIGVNKVHSDRAYDIVLVSRFKSWDDLKIYREHPEHVSVAGFIGSVVQEAAVVDYEY